MTMRIVVALGLGLLLVGCVTRPPQRSGSPASPSASFSPTAPAALVPRAVAIAEEARAYPDEYCGKFILQPGPGVDPAAGGDFVSLWRAHLDAHAAAIRAHADRPAEMQFGTCRFSELDREQLMAALNPPDVGWLAAIPAVVVSSDDNVEQNRVDLYISSSVPDAAARVLAHYSTAFGLPAGILHVESDGNGAALRPWGTVRVSVVGTGGRPVGPNQLGLEWHGELENMECGGGDMGYGVPADGSATELPCQAGRWTIVAVAGGIVYGSGEVTAKGNASVDLTIRLTSAPPK